MSPPPDHARTDLAEQVADILRAHLSVGAPGADVVDALGVYCAALAAATEHINLTGVTDAEGMALRHVLDSLTVSPLLEGVGTLLDLGSGGGLPGIPLALAHPDLTVTLCESRTRKAAAVRSIGDRARTAARLRGLGVTVIDEVPGRMAPALADAYLRVKATGRL